MLNYGSQTNPIKADQVFVVKFWQNASERKKVTTEVPIGIGELLKWSETLVQQNPSTSNK